MCSSDLAMLQITNNDVSKNPFIIHLAGTGATNSVPVFSNNGAPTTNGFQLTFSAGMGQHFRILGSGDVTQPLADWTVITSGTVASNPVVFIDPAASTNHLQFYRIVSP